MGDDHWCSFCEENLKGKKHIKIVFENWVEKEVGKKKKKKILVERITCICLKCLSTPEKWAECFKDEVLRVEDLPSFFEKLSLVGKNPLFRAKIICVNRMECQSFKPSQKGILECEDMLLDYAADDISGLNNVYAKCGLGHEGITPIFSDDGDETAALVRRRAINRELEYYKEVYGKLADTLDLSKKQREKLIKTIGEGLMIFDSKYLR